jgi:N-carbamoyl-L-amino-acid hydrolase
MISRRSFLSLASASALAIPTIAWSRQATRPAVDAARLRNRLERLSTHGRPSGGTFADGVSRVAYSVADLTARAFIIDEIKGADIVPRIDAAGNIFARFGGQPNQPAILFGSHIDSVPNGGNFDGDLGVFAALGVIQAVQAAKVQTRHPLEMVLWAHGESTAFGVGAAASRIVAGDLKPGDMDQTWNGMKRSDAIKRIAGNPDQIETAVRGKGTWHSYVELHIEPGGTLAAAKIPIGIGEPASSGVQAAIGKAASALSLQTRALPSGAGHDAQQIARLCPTGMIFVPSVGGVSHSPKELATWDDCARGANVLLGTVLELDARDSV